MIHYYFGDKQGLYVRALQLAIKLLRPLPQAMELDSTVPVDAVVKVVEAIVDQMASPRWLCAWWYWKTSSVTQI